MKKPLYQLKQRHDVIRQFTPNWFTVTMGVGVVALILAEFSVFAQSINMFATLLWQMNIVLFSLFSVLYILRWLIYPHEARIFTLTQVWHCFWVQFPWDLRLKIMQWFLKVWCSVIW